MLVRDVRALEDLARRLYPVLVLLDAEDAGATNNALLRGILTVDPCPRLVLITNQLVAQSIAQFRNLGVSGFVSRVDPAAGWLAVVQKVLSGQSSVAQSAIRRTHVPITDGEPDPETLFRSLTDRERRVLYHLWLGHSLRTTANRLNLTVKSVDYYSCNLRRKLRVRSRVALVHLASRFEKLMLDESVAGPNPPQMA